MSRVARARRASAVALAGAASVLVGACTRDFDAPFASPPVECPAPGDAADAANGDSPYARAVLAAKPAAYYRFDDRDGVFRSVVPGAPEGRGAGPLTAARGALYGDRSPSASFAPGAGIDFGDAFGRLGTTFFTVELWVRPGGAEAERMLFSKEVDVTEPERRAGFALSITRANVVRFARWPGTLDNRYATILELPIGDLDRWHHVAVRQTDDRLTLFVDAVPRELDASVAASFVTTQASFVLGAANGFQLVGRVDELAVYERAVTHDELIAHVNAAASRTCAKDETGLVCLGPDQVAECAGGIPSVRRACLEDVCRVDGPAASARCEVDPCAR